MLFFRVCKIPVKFMIKNHGFPEKISFKLEFINSDEPFQYKLKLLKLNERKNRSKHDFSYPYFIWEGMTEKDIIDLNYDVYFILYFLR